MDTGELGQHLRSLREARGIGLRDASRQASISHGYISMIERGERRPTEEILRKLAPVYGVPAEELLRLLGETEPIAAEVSEEEEVERAFRFVLADPRFRFGTRPDGAGLTLKAKRFIVEMYEQLTGKRLLG